MSTQATISATQTLAGRFERPQRLLIGGEWRSAHSGARIDALDPATGEVFAQVAAGGAREVDEAVRAARAAFERGPWRALSPAARGELLWKLADLIEANAQEIALLDTLDSGMPLWLSRQFSVGKAIECLRYNAGWATKITGETLAVSTPGEYHTYTVREPVGVVGQIVAWNMPFGMACGKIAPALAAGCTVILKPAEQTSLSAIRLGELVQEAGFPAGTVNVVTGLGPEAGQALVLHADVNKISFTGSTRVGKSILAAAAGNLKRVTLELGGKSPLIIFPDAPLDAASTAAAYGIMINTGQICAAGSRVFVHEKVYEQVLGAIEAHASAISIGPGQDPGTFMGPVVSLQQLERVNGYIRSAHEAGARVVRGTQSLPARGYFTAPAIVSDVSTGAAVAREEVFGPVLCVTRFRDEDVDDIARLANDTTYGLAAHIWTRDVSVAHRLASRIRAGSISVNGGAGMDFCMPFGGCKQSGIGREHGREGIESYTETKTVSITLSAPPTGERSAAAGQ